MFKQTFHQFAKSGERNTWIESEYIQIYLRKGFHLWDGQIRECIDVANVAVGPKYRSQGIFTSVMDVIEKRKAKPYVFVENIIGENAEYARRLISFLERRGYEHVSVAVSPTCMIKKL